MRPIVRSQTGTGNSTPGFLNIHISPFNVALRVAVTGTVTYSVQYTLDNAYDPAVTPAWVTHPDFSALTADAVGNLAFPVIAVRVNVSAGTGTATLTAIQAGIK